MTFQVNTCSRYEIRKASRHRPAVSIFQRRRSTDSVEDQLSFLCKPPAGPIRKAAPIRYRWQNFRHRCGPTISIRFPAGHDHHSRTCFNFRLRLKNHQLRYSCPGISFGHFVYTLLHSWPLPVIKLSQRLQTTMMMTMTTTEMMNDYIAAIPWPSY